MLENHMQEKLTSVVHTLEQDLHYVNEERQLLVLQNEQFR
jgi:hypothetical protein